MTTRAQIVAAAREWIGTPWHHQQMTKGVGADCLGFVAGVAYELGIFDARPAVRDPEFRGYGREPNPQMLDKVCSEYADRISIRDVDLGDIVSIVVRGAVYPQHFAIVAELGEDGRPYKIVHATSAQPRAVIEERVDRYTWSRISRVYRFRGIEG